jgi:hypothetical protein
MRGAVSVALATAYFDLGSVRSGISSGLSGDGHRATLVLATLLTVLITIVGRAHTRLCLVLVTSPTSVCISAITT